MKAAHRIELRSRANNHFVYSGRSLLVTNRDGEVTGEGTEGFYVENTRLLSRDQLTADGNALTPIVATPVGGSAFLAYAEVPQGPNVPSESAYVQVARFVGDGMRTLARVANYGREEVAFALALHVAADFADVEEAERGQREQTADVETGWDERRREAVFRYRHPKLDRAVAVRVERAPVPTAFSDGALVFQLDLGDHEQVELEVAVEPLFDGRRGGSPPSSFAESGGGLARVRGEIAEEAPTLTTTNSTVARAWETATADLATLALGLDPGPGTPIAGVPIYQQFFGRDALTITWQSLLASKTMARDTLLLNAAFQGTTIDDWRDEEPGKMIHQARSGPLSLLEVDPFLRYYGDYATPPDFLIVLGQYLAWTNDVATVRTLLPAARGAIEWIERYADLDGDGFVEYVKRSKKGVKNQGWKDSDEAIVDERGEIVENPIATCELQAYVYAALQQAALVFALAGDAAYGLELLGKARDLKRRFDPAFWLEGEGFYALALGPQKQQVRSVASNAGHLLAAGLVPRKKGRRVARRLMEPDMFSGWGVRTLSSDHATYNPFSYHLGSVWPVENGTFAFGFGRYGCIAELHRLAEGLFASTELFIGNRLPESIGGLPRDAAHPHPGIYRASNEPQGWSASMVVLLVQSLLGMRPVAPLGLLLVDPQLPPWLPDLRLDGVRVGRARLDLEFRRTRGGETRYRVRRREGGVRVLRQPPPQAPEGNVTGRARAALGSLARL